MDALAVFPMGAVLKPDQPDDTPPELLEWRPTDDHTRTGFKAHTVLGILGHSLNTCGQKRAVFRAACHMSKRTSLPSSSA